MSRTIAAAVCSGLLLVVSGALHAQSGPGVRAPLQRAPAATIIAIKGNLVTIADKTGSRRTVEIASVKDLRIGTPVSWCEEDCRVLTTADGSIPVTRVLQ